MSVSLKAVIIRAKFLSTSQAFLHMSIDETHCNELLCKIDIIITIPIIQMKTPRLGRVR